jgi:hypothetical protein
MRTVMPHLLGYPWISLDLIGCMYVSTAAVSMLVAAILTGSPQALYLSLSLPIPTFCSFWKVASYHILSAYTRFFSHHVYRSSLSCFTPILAVLSLSCLCWVSCPQLFQQWPEQVSRAVHGFTYKLVEVRRCLQA